MHFCWEKNWTLLMLKISLLRKCHQWAYPQSTDQNVNIFPLVKSTDDTQNEDASLAIEENITNLATEILEDNPIRKWICFLFALALLNVVLYLRPWILINFLFVKFGYLLISPSPASFYVMFLHCFFLCDVSSLTLPFV